MKIILYPVFHGKLITNYKKTLTRPLLIRLNQKNFLHYNDKIKILVIFIWSSSF